MNQVERCVICAATIESRDGGLCDKHKYDEQRARHNSPSVFWHDLQADMLNPEFRDAYADAAGEITTLDGIANADPA